MLNYLFTDSGIILSQSVLNEILIEMQWCTRNTYSDSNTDNLGRCILHATDKPCTASIQVFYIFINKFIIEKPTFLTYFISLLLFLKYNTVDYYKIFGSKYF